MSPPSVLILHETPPLNPPRSGLVQQIAADNHLHPVQVTQWKGQMMESAAGVFERGGNQASREQQEEKEKARLERKVGQLAVEVDWLKKSARNWGSIQEGCDGGENGFSAQRETAVRAFGPQPQPPESAEAAQPWAGRVGDGEAD